MTYKKDPYTGYEYWLDYDENGNIIHYKNSNGNEKWYDYDENGNIIHYKIPMEMNIGWNMTRTEI